MKKTIVSLVVVFAAVTAGGVRAQSNPLLGGVPTESATADTIPLSLGDAIRRGLDHNLALILAQEDVAQAAAGRDRELARLLPQVDGHLAASRQKVSLEAFGFTDFPGLPVVIGPFPVYDARVGATAHFGLQQLGKLESGEKGVEAADASLAATRDLVVLVCGNLYLRAATEESRIEAARAEAETAAALEELASDREKAGLAASIDVVRAQVERASRDQAVIEAENAGTRARLALARAIGLPLAQEFELTDSVDSSRPGPDWSVDQAIAKARDHRADRKSAQAAVEAAEASVAAAKGEHLPSLELHADWGEIGQHVDDLRTTYQVAAGVRVPLFAGGGTRAAVKSAEAELARRRARLADLEVEIEMQVRSAMADLSAARARVVVAEKGRALAEQELGLARDRFTAGVADNVDVVFAQEAVATAIERRIGAVYDFDLARAALARAVGGAETMFRGLIEGGQE